MRKRTGGLYDDIQSFLRPESIHGHECVLSIRRAISPADGAIRARGDGIDIARGVHHSDLLGHRWHYSAELLGCKAWFAETDVCTSKYTLYCVPVKLSG